MELNYKVSEIKNIQQTVDQIIVEKGTAAKSVIPVLQAIQTTFNYLPEEALRYVCEKRKLLPDRLGVVLWFTRKFRWLR